MANAAETPQAAYQTALMNCLMLMARTVEDTVNRALDAVCCRNQPVASQLANEILMLEPHINDMEMVIDDHAVYLLHLNQLPAEDIRLVVATLKITNDLERMGDLAVNIGERVISLAQMPPVEAPADLAPMAEAVRAMVSKSLGALIFRSTVLANLVLESDDVVDRYRDQLFEHLSAGMMQNPGVVESNMQFVLATRHLERIADHATNIAEDVIFWVRGLDVRHGRGGTLATHASPGVTENSSAA